MSKKYKSDDLLESCITSTEISCTKCHTTNVLHNVDEFGAIDSFFEDGWKATPNHTYCPKCSKKYLKT